MRERLHLRSIRQPGQVNGGPIWMHRSCGFASTIRTRWSESLPMANWFRQRKRRVSGSCSCASGVLRLAGRTRRGDSGAQQTVRTYLMIAVALLAVDASAGESGAQQTVRTYLMIAVALLAVD